MALTNKDATKILIKVTELQKNKDVTGNYVYIRKIRRRTYSD